MADALVGVTPVQGKLPVSPMDAPWREGDGLSWEGHQRLGKWVDARSEAWDEASLRVDSLLEVALTEEALPGARVVVAHRGHIVMDKYVGTLDGTSPVTPHAVYDLASITKVAVTANALMRMTAKGELDVDAPLRTVMSRLEDHPLGTRTVREVLTHQAGLEPWIPFYLAALQDSSGVFGETPTEGCDIEITPELYLEEAYTDSVWAMILAQNSSPRQVQVQRPGILLVDGHVRRARHGS